MDARAIAPIGSGARVGGPHGLEGQHPLPVLNGCAIRVLVDLPSGAVRIERKIATGGARAR